MSNQILIKRSAIQSKIPTTSDLALGELGINTYDGKLYTRKNDGTDTIIELTANQTITVSGDATGSGSSAVTISLVNSGVSAGTYNNSATSITPFTVDTKGRITTTGAPVTITPAFANITAKPTTLAGYGITDAQPLDSTLTSLAAASKVTTGLVKSTNGVISLDSTAYITSNQTITVSGDVSGSGTTAITLNLATSGITAGTYTKITVDAKGRGISGAQLASGDVTTALGFTPVSATGNIANLTGGAAGSVPYQSATNTTGQTAAGTSGQVLTSNGSSAPTWQTQSAGGAVTSITGTANQITVSASTGAVTLSLPANITGLTNVTATNFSGLANQASAIAGGNAGSVPYQISNGNTAFTTVGSSGFVLRSNGTSAPTWTDQPAINGASIIASTIPVASLVSKSVTLTAGSGITISNAGVATLGSGVSITNVDTLASVTARGATTGDATTFTNATASSSAITGALIVTGGTGVTGNSTFGGNLNFSGVGKFITADWSNATAASRVYLQTSTANSTTSVGIIPNGTNQTANVAISNSSDPTNTSLITLATSATSVSINSTNRGTGTVVPLLFTTSGTTAITIDASQNVTLNGTNTIGNVPSPVSSLQVANKAYVDSTIANAGYGPPITTVNTTSQAATSNNQYVLANTTALTTISLPASPANGDVVWITNATGRTDCVVANNGLLLMGLSENMTIDQTNVTIQLRYISVTVGWRII